MYARQSSQLATQNGSRILPLLMAVIVIVTAVALAFGVRTIASQGASVAEPAAAQAYDSPALRNGDAFGTVALPQYDSPALRGGDTFSVATQPRYESPALRAPLAGVAPKAIAVETADSLRKEHLGSAAAIIGTKGIVSGRDRIEIHRLEHLGTSAATTQPVVSFDTWDALRKEHQAGVVTSVDSWDSPSGEHPGGGGR